METDALPLERGNVDLSSIGQNYPSLHAPPHLLFEDTLPSTHEPQHGAMTYGTVPTRFPKAEHVPLRPKRAWPRWWRAQVLPIVVNGTSGLIAFLLSSTLAVSCASVFVGHGTPLAPVLARFIDINLLGTAILSIVLAWQSRAPWTLGSIDVFVAPILSDMAEKISSRLEGQLDVVVPTTIVMVALTSTLLGLVFFTMGWFRVTSIANYMPYPVIAGFLSGIGAELMKNGVHMASSHALSWAFFSVDTLRLLVPAILFAAVARLAQYWKIPVAISFPCLLLVSLLGFQGAAYLWDASMDELGHAGWVFAWDPAVVARTPMWYPWATIEWTHVQWRTVFDECPGYLISLVILGALKYSVATTSLSTLFDRDISPDHEMRVIGVANLVTGLLGCCGGCHYLSAMGIMKQLNAHEKVPALLNAALVLVLWMKGIHLLEYVPKFIFGGLLLSVGLHFLEAYLVAPCHFLKPVEKSTVVLIASSFLVIGMLASVALGILISMIELIWRIHAVGCVHHETSGALVRSAVDRTPAQVAALDEAGAAIFVLRLQGYLFFGTSVNLVERMATRVQTLPKLESVVIDLGLVPSFDATALLNFRKASTLADTHGFDIFFCGLSPKLERALRRNPVSERVHLLRSDVDIALELCENRLLADEGGHGAYRDGQKVTSTQLWHVFLAAAVEAKHTVDARHLVPLATYLEMVHVPNQAPFVPARDTTYFICLGDIEVTLATAFTGAPPSMPEKDTTEVPKRRKGSLAGPETPQWTPFTTSTSRLLKMGPGSVITPNLTNLDPEYKYVARANCFVLRLGGAAMAELEQEAPETAVAVLKLITVRLASRFRHASQRVSQMSSLLYK
ncbi:hypothetical protein PsorP6_003062 [Peronosclerospora sorghi]|uniref:Uncharacterized protein n=1 Tax=Peronosclerospora sorghi TaxID=230839 RepID=A0ACC0VMG0_9STRA|nr:hypothetical protein PsorP6_003062 [Peronosclerospora sorghi]